MKYDVYDKNNRLVWVDDSDIETAFENKENELPMEIIRAMGRTHQSKYIVRLGEVLDDADASRMRRVNSAYAIRKLGGEQALALLKKRCDSISDEELNDVFSEKRILQTLILHMEKGPKGALEYFMDENSNAAIKEILLCNYNLGFPFCYDDLILVIRFLILFLKKETKWIRKLPKADYDDDVYFALEVLWNIMDESDLLQNLRQEELKDLVIISEKVLKRTNDEKELIAIYARGLPKEQALQVLNPIMNKVRGDAEKELKKTLMMMEIE